MYTRIYFLLTGMLAIAAAGVACPAAGHLRDPLKSAIAAIKFQENAVHNIRVASFSRNWQVGNAGARMISAGEVRSVALYDGLPRGKFLIRVLRDVAPWSNGKGPFSLREFVVGFDGRVGTFLQTVDGTPKREALDEDGLLMGRNPLYLYGYLDIDNGWAESVFGFTSFPEFIPPYHLQYRRFSAFISPGQPLTTVRARWVRVRGGRLLRVTRVGPPLGKDVFLLDPRHDYSIERYYFYGFTTRKGPDGRVIRAPNGSDRLFPGTRRQSEFRVTGFFQPRPGVFFPKRISRLGFAWWKNNGTGVVARTEITISKVSVNVHEAKGGAYDVAFPIGASVIDTSTGQRIIVGGTLNQELREIHHAVGAARAAASRDSASHNQR
jgi:hypothetical protein